MLKKLNKLQITLIILTAAVLLAAALFVILRGDGFAPSAEPHYDWRMYSSLEEISKDSEAVIVGRVLETKGPVSINITVEDGVPSQFVDYMVCKVEVLDVASGKLEKGDIIEMKQGIEDWAYELSEKEEGIMFLYDFRDLTDVAPFVMVNRDQGMISRDIAKGKADAKTSLGVKSDEFDGIWKEIKGYLN